MRSVFLCESPDNIFYVYAEETVRVLRETAGLETERVFDRATLLADPELGRDVTFAFSTWGMPALTEEEIRTALPALRAVFYAAGSVQTFAVPFLALGIRIFSAREANAVPVAEFTVSEIVLAGKGFYRASAMMKKEGRPAAKEISSRYRGNYGATVGILGAGAVGRRVIEMLTAYNLRVIVFDPFLTDDEARRLNVCKSDLATVFSGSDVVSNHLADNPETRGILNGDLFRTMRPNATFINTGRGAQVVEEDLIGTLKDRPDLTALLDVTFPEPPEAGSELYTLENCILTPHIAGSCGDEVHRMADQMLQAFNCFRAGRSSSCEVTADMLKTMA